MISNTTATNKAPHEAPKKIRTIFWCIAVTVFALGQGALAMRFVADAQAHEVPECREPSLMYRADTIAAFAMQCLGDANLALAAANAMAALHREPSNQLALATLGSLAEVGANASEAEAWFERSKRFGRRDFTTETYWLNKAAEEHDQGKIAEHIDALLRAGWKSDLAERQARVLESTESGRVALVDVIRPNTPWINSYFSDISELSVAACRNRGIMLTLLAERHKPDSIIRIATALPTIRALYEAGDIQGAYALHTKLQPLASQATVNDTELPSSSLSLLGPFDWTFHSSPELELEAGRMSGPSVHLRTGDSDTGRYLIADRTIKLEPGAYELLISGHGSAPVNTSFTAKFVGVSNDGTVKAAKLLMPQDGRPAVTSIDVAGSSSFFRLSLFLDISEASQNVDVQIDAIRIERR